MSERIVALRAREVVVPLPRPFRVGPMLVARREYALVEAVGASGLRGVAYALTRGAPVVEAIEKLFAPLVVGRETGEVDSVFRDCFRATIAVGRVGLVMRALSLVDIALWDLRARAEGAPLWRALGGSDPTVEAMIVSGYPTGEPAERVAAHCAALARQGWRRQKVARFPDPRDLELVLAAAETVPGGIDFVVDAGWIWESAREAAAEIGKWPPVRLAWLEDPLPPENARSYLELRELVDVPLGAGDELTDPFVLERLLELDAVDVVRLDVTTLGGVTGTLRAAASVVAAGRPISFHVYPETSIHLAAVLPGATVELFEPDDGRIDPAASLYRGGPTIMPGALVASDRPGLGIELEEPRASS